MHNEFFRIIILKDTYSINTKLLIFNRKHNSQCILDAIRIVYDYALYIVNYALKLDYEER